MTTFFYELGALEKAYFICALLGGALFVVRLVLALIGGDSDADGDVDGGFDVDGDSDSSFKALSIQSLTSFFMMFGLVGLACSRSSLYAYVSLPAAFAAGVATVWVTARIFQFVRSFQSSGNLNAEQAVGQHATVYLTIPSGGTGKIHVTVQGRLAEYSAVSDSSAPLPTGTRVLVTRAVNDSTLAVSLLQEVKPS